MLSRRAMLALGLGLPGSLAAQRPVTIERRPAPASKEEAEIVPSIRVDTSLVLIPVMVTDRINRPVTGLEKEHFRIFDDRVEQSITAFAMDDAPVAVGLVFDVSGSMRNKLGRSRMAASEFFRTSNEEDEFFLVQFDDAPHLTVGLTRDTGRIESQLIFTRSRGSTALMDAIYLALHEMKKSKKNKKALLIISDGGDNHSRYTRAEVDNIVRESDVLIYAIGVFGGAGTTEEVGGPALLNRISEQTGGRLYETGSVELPDIARKIGVDLRNRYILGYAPTNVQRDGRYHSVRVRVVPPRGLSQLKAHWRMGYYAPGD